MPDPTPLDTRIEVVDPADLILLEKNARFMTHEQFTRLVDNVRRDGCLTSVPFAHYDQAKGGYVVLSGNHRVKAAREVGLTEVAVMVTDQPLEAARQIALQLSHNAITGQDDPAILKELWEQIDDVDWREFAGLDDKTLELLADVKPGQIGEAQLDFQTLTLLFLPGELERMKAAMDDAWALSKAADATWVAHLAQYDRFADAVDMMSRAGSVQNQATALGLILDVFYEHLTDLRRQWREEREDQAWVPVPSVTGWEMPQTAAAVVAQAIDRMIARAEANHPWQVLELLAADYLAGPEEDS